MKLFPDVIITLAVALAGPYLYLHMDKDAKSMSASILSQVVLQPDQSTSVQGLQMLINGIPIVEPFHSVIELSNDGMKPIIASDFEVPLEIRLKSETQIVGARVMGKSPNDIDAEISWDKDVIRLKPMLLNSSDKFTISILTSGGQPQFVTKARIVGIPAVAIIDTTKETVNLGRKVFWFLLTFLFITAWLANLQAFNSLKTDGVISMTRTRMYGRLFVFHITFLPLTAGIFISFVLAETDYDLFAYQVLLTMVTIGLAFPLASKLVRKPIPRDVLSQDPLISK